MNVQGTQIKAYAHVIDSVANPEPGDSRNMIYWRVAQKCGVTYERVVDLCHDRLYVETSPGVHENAWKRGII